MLRSYLAYAIQANEVFTTVFKLDAVFLQRLVEPVLFVFTLVSRCLTSHEQKQILILAQTLTSDPYKPGPLKTRLSVDSLKTKTISISQFFHAKEKRRSFMLTRIRNCFPSEIAIRMSYFKEYNLC